MKVLLPQSSESLVGFAIAESEKEVPAGCSYVGDEANRKSIQEP